MKRVILACALVVLLTGCNSIRTNMWTRAEDENLHPDPCHNLKGIPVMLKVPSHLEVTITETLYVQYKVDSDHDTGKLQVIKLDRPDLDVIANLKYTEKMFLVDPVRVGAGTGSYGFGFGPANKDLPPIAGEDGTNAGHGYIHNANFKANDQTIIRSANLLSTVLSLRPKASGKAGLLDPNSLQESAQTIVKMTRTVAYHRFDLGSPTVDDEVFAFMEQHLNGCHNSCPELSVNDTAVPPAPANSQDNHSK
jgi:hypothetical protein